MGTVLQVTTGYQDISKWKRICSVCCAPNHTVGLRWDGTVVAMGSNKYGQCNVGKWSEIVQIAAGIYYTAGLKADGTVVLASTSGWWDKGGAHDWTDVKMITGADLHLVGRHTDGTFSVDGSHAYGEDMVFHWKDLDIVALSSAVNHTMGLTAEGTVVVTENGFDYDGRSEWKDIVAIASAPDHIAGLKSDGMVVAVGAKLCDYGQLNVRDWTGITAIACGEYFTVGLRSDGTVLAVGDNRHGQCEVSGWTDITAITCGRDRTVGVKCDGTVVMAGGSLTTHSRKL